MSRRPRVVFFGEAVTLAHVARTLVLGEALLTDHDVVLALAPKAQRFAMPGRFVMRDLESIATEQFVEALRLGRPLYDESTLRRYVDNDLRLIDELAPDLIVGDFRISLGVSARLRSVPYLTITNAYWSPWFRPPPPLPVLPWTKRVPLPLAKAVFAIARVPAMSAHAVPMNRVRKGVGLPGLGADLRRVYTDADHVAYGDVAELFPTPGAPETHTYLGPILWSPDVPPPEWWDEPIAGQAAYVTMGSSGDPELLNAIVSALDALGVTALVATAGAAFTPASGSLARIADYLPGTEAARRVDLVVCNGGSMTSQQALAAGKPVLGIASNMDQFFNMRAICESGSGLLVRADRASAQIIRLAASRLLKEAESQAAAQRLSAVFQRYSARQTFRRIVGNILGAAT